MKSKRKHKFIKYLFVYVPCWFVIITLSWVLLLKYVPVYYTPLMAVRSYEYRDDSSFKTYKTWKNLEDISINLSMAVIVAEDARFASHSGFDFVEIKNAVEDAQKGKKLRGASTISQQTAKNVFCYPSDGWIRKGFEAYFTFLIEKIWGKRRILEVYLNVAEMGKGIYGAEAAAERLFHTRANKLNKIQGAAIAACLPNPIKRKANAPTKYLSGRISNIVKEVYRTPVPDFLREEK